MDYKAMFLDHLRSQGRDEKTIVTYVGAFNRFEKCISTHQSENGLESRGVGRGAGGPLPLHLASQPDILFFRSWLLAHYKNSTAVLTLKLVNAFFAWAVERRYIPDNPIEYIDRPTPTKSPTKWLTTDEQNSVIREARRVHCGIDKTPTDTQRAAQLREYAIVLTFLRAGLRVEELCDLRIADLTITDRKGILYVKGKGDKDRTIPLCKELRATLSRYLESRKENPSPFVFSSQRSEQSTVRAIQFIIEGYADRLKMPHLSCHTLRHTFGHDLAVQHVPLDVIARLMGHSKADGSPNIAMTMKYTSPGLSDLESAVELISWN